MLRCVIWTAFGEPVEPDVSCMSARSSSPVSTGSIGSASSRSVILRTLMPFSSSTGIATRNGSETMTALASIMPMTFMVSSAHTARSVRGVGWCSIVRLAPRIHSAWAVGAISTGKPASTPTASPRSYAGGGQATRDAPGALVNLAPGVADGLVGFTGDHARRRRPRIAEHLLGKSAHDNLLGGQAPVPSSSMLRLPVHTFREARVHDWEAVVSRIGDVAAHWDIVVQAKPSRSGASAVRSPTQMSGGRSRRVVRVTASIHRRSS